MSIQSILALGGVLGAMAVLALAVRGVRRWPVAGILAGYGSLLSQWDFPAQAQIVNIFGLSLYFPDLVAVILACAAMGSIPILYRNAPSIALLIALLWVLLISSLIRGVSLFGLGHAVSEWRILFLPFAVLTWGLSLEWSRESVQALIVRPMHWLGWILVALASYHGLRYGVGSATSAFVEIDGIEQTTRVLTQMQAIVLSLSLILAVEHWADRRTAVGALGIVVFTSILIVSQQRTVWFACIAGLLVLLVRVSQERKKSLLVLIVLLGWGSLVILLSGIGSSLWLEVVSSLLDRSTYNSRTEGWEQLISQALGNGIGGILFGGASGSGWVRLDPNGAIVRFSPHNWYVLLFLRVGLVGVVAYLAILVSAVVRLARRASSASALAVLVAVAVFCWAYGISWTFAPIVAWVVVAGYSRDESFGAYASQMPAAPRKDEYLTG